MSYPNQNRTQHETHKTKNTNCEYCAKSDREILEEMSWNIDSPESRVKVLPIPKGFVSAPRRADGQHY